MCRRIGNDLHHILTQATSHINKLVSDAKEAGKSWTPLESAIVALD